MHTFHNISAPNAHTTITCCTFTSKQYQTITVLYPIQSISCVCSSKIQNSPPPRFGLRCHKLRKRSLWGRRRLLRKLGRRCAPATTTWKCQLVYIPLMEEILHHLGMAETLWILGSSSSLVVQDFVHQQYDWGKLALNPGILWIWPAETPLHGFPKFSSSDHVTTFCNLTYFFLPKNEILVGGWTNPSEKNMLFSKWVKIFPKKGSGWT